MADAYETGAMFSGDRPSGLRDYYEQLLLETLRTNSILVPYTTVKEQFAARDTGVIIFSEVLDTEPNWSPLQETTIWLPGAHLDSRSVRIELEIHGDKIAISDYNELVNFWANGDLRGLVKGKLGQSMVDYLDILARNAFLSVDSRYKTFVGSGGDREGLTAADVMSTDYVDLARIHLEEREIPGVATPDGVGKAIVCVTSPRVIHDIRTTASNKWLDAQLYAGSTRLFNGEVGTWNGVRFIKTNRLRLLNYGNKTAQSALGGATVAGQGALATVDTVYSVGQSGSTRTVPVADASVFSIGDYVTIHDDGNSGPSDNPIEADGSQETRRVMDLDASADTLSFDRPLMKPHESGNYVTKGVAVHASLFMGGPAVVYGIGERPHPLVLPKIDDLGMIQRFSWRGFLKFQMFRPEFLEVVESGGSIT